MNKRLLLSKMMWFGDDQEALAKALNVSKGTLSSRMNGHSEFGLDEIKAICDRYSLTNNELNAIFFNKELS